jgi:hypothetical protein
MSFRHFSLSVCGEPSKFSFLPYRWIASHPSLILMSPSVADEPLRKWPREDNSSRSSSSLSELQKRWSAKALPPERRISLCWCWSNSTHNAFLIWSKVSSACSKKPNTMDELNSLSPGSSISRICSKVSMSMLSPKSTSPAVSLCG